MNSYSWSLITVVLDGRGLLVEAMVCVPNLQKSITVTKAGNNISRGHSNGTLMDMYKLPLCGLFPGWQTMLISRNFAITIDLL